MRLRSLTVCTLSASAVLLLAGCAGITSQLPAQISNAAQPASALNGTTATQSVAMTQSAGSSVSDENAELSIDAVSPDLSKTSYVYDGTESIRSAVSTRPPIVKTRHRTVTYTSGATFNGKKNLTDEHIVDTTTFASDTGTITTDDYDQLTTAGTVSTLVNYGGAQTQSDSNVSGTSSYVITNTAAATLGRYPLKKGASWSQYVPYTYQGTSAFGGPPNVTSDTGTVNGDGTYASQTQYDDGHVVTVSLAATALTKVSINTGTATTTYRFGVPKAGKIPLQVTGPTAPAPSSIPDWYPGGGVPSPFASTQSTVLGAIALPASCVVKPVFVPTKPMLVETKMTMTDPGLGYTEALTIDSYQVAGIGEVCRVETDTLLAYYAFDDIPADTIFGTHAGGLLGGHTATIVLSLTSFSGAAYPARGMNAAAHVLTTSHP